MQAGFARVAAGAIVAAILAGALVARATLALVLVTLVGALALATAIVLALAFLLRAVAHASTAETILFATPVFIVASSGFAAAARLITNVSKITLQVVDLPAELVELPFDLADLPIGITAAALLALRHAASLFIAGLSGTATLLPRVLLPRILLATRAATAQDERFLPRFKLAAESAFVLVSPYVEFDFLARVHVADLGDELIRRLDTATIKVGNAVAFAEPHFIGRAVAVDANHAQTFAAAILSNRDAEARIVIRLAAALLRTAAILLLVPIPLLVASAAVVIAVGLREPATIVPLLPVALAELLPVALTGLLAALTILLLVAGALLILLVLLLVLLGPLPLLLATLLLLLGALAILVLAVFIFIFVLFVAIAILVAGLGIVVGRLTLRFVALGLVLILFSERAIDGHDHREASQQASPPISFHNVQHPRVSFRA
jgi:hypothetical protein